jgi:F-type H+-transporting ATPase subunit gamma
MRGYFDDGAIDSLYIAYTRFVSTSRHVPTIEQILPVQPAETEDDAGLEYIFEPNAAELIDTVVPMAVDAELRYYLLQALASEHAARMIAMTTSSDNAEKMRNDLSKQLNRARQERITSDVLEVVTGAEALRQR